RAREAGVTIIEGAIPQRRQRSHVEFAARFDDAACWELVYEFVSARRRELDAQRGRSADVAPEPGVPAAAGREPIARSAHLHLQAQFARRQLESLPDSSWPRPAVVEVDSHFADARRAG